jgi:hypothetical protein
MLKIINEKILVKNEVDVLIILLAYQQSMESKGRCIKVIKKNLHQRNKRVLLLYSELKLEYPGNRW